MKNVKVKYSRKNFAQLLCNLTPLTTDLVWKNQAECNNNNNNDQDVNQ